MSNFPQAFVTGKFSPEDTYLKILADAIFAWGLVMAGNKPPENFGLGMVDASKRLNSSAHPDDLSKLADEAIEKLNQKSAAK